MYVKIIQTINMEYPKPIVYLFYRRSRKDVLIVQKGNKNAFMVVHMLSYLSEKSETGQ